jgi:rhamnosyltransferase
MTKNRLAAVVTLYNPSWTVVRNIGTYLGNVDLLILYDNSPDKSKEVTEKFTPMEKVRYITAGKNAGIGRALNEAAEYAIGNGCEFLIMMDQDSSTDVGMIDELVSVANRRPDAGIVSPLHLVKNDIIPRTASDIEPVLTAMTSGSLLRLEAFKKCGRFTEELFIDYIDLEYCLRMKKNGIPVLRANKALLFHEVGSLTSRKFLLWQVHPSNHEPFRLFFRTRNRYHIKRKYRDDFPDYFKKDSKSFRRELVKIIFYEKERLKKISMIIRGYAAYRRRDFTNDIYPD